MPREPDNGRKRNPGRIPKAEVRVPVSTNVAMATPSNRLRANPFHVLGATTRDNRSRITELAEECSLIADEAECRAASNALLNPRARLASEMAWLPGISPGRASQIAREMTGLHAFPTGELPPLAKANVLSAVIETMDATFDVRSVKAIIIQLANAVEAVNLEEVIQHINEDRVIAGFVEVGDTTLAYVEMDKLSGFYRNAVSGLLDKFPTHILVQVVSSIASETTADGTRLPPSLIEDVVNAYETSAQGFIERESKTLRSLVERAKASHGLGEEYVMSVVDQIEHSVDNFNSVISPVQKVRQAAGGTHEVLKDVGFAIRGLSVDLHNEFGWLSAPTKLTTMLEDKFSDQDVLKECVASDRAFLAKAESERQAAAQRQQDFDRSITYGADIGILGKQRIEISPTGVRWKHQHIKLEAVTRLRWGSTRRSVNGIPTGTTMMVFVGDLRDHFTLTFRDKEIYGNLVDRLWRAIGFRLLCEQVKILKAKGSLTMPGVVVSDEGVHLLKHHFFSGRTEMSKVAWPNVRILAQNGHFTIKDITDKKVYTALSYQGDDNVHVLEHLIRAYFEGKKKLISELLD